MPQGNPDHTRGLFTPKYTYSTPAKAIKARQPRQELDATDLALVDAVLEDPDVESASRSIGLTLHEAQRRFQRATVRAALQAARHRRNGRMATQPDHVLRTWLTIADADPRELSEHWLKPCRHCYGLDHRYQFDDVELAAATSAYRMAYEFGARGLSHAVDKAMVGEAYAQIERAWDWGKREAELPPFDDLGGGGYTILKQPLRGPDWVAFVRDQGVAIRNPQATGEFTCPRCFGFGENHVIFHDTRTMSPAAASLYLGVEMMAGGGFRIVRRDQDQIRLLIAKHMGYFPSERRSLDVVDPDALSLEQLDKVIEVAERRLSDLRGEADGEYPALAPTEASEG